MNIKYDINTGTIWNENNQVKNVNAHYNYTTILNMENKIEMTQKILNEYQTDLKFIKDKNFIKKLLGSLLGITSIVIFVKLIKYFTISKFIIGFIFAILSPFIYKSNDKYSEVVLNEKIHIIKNILNDMEVKLNDISLEKNITLTNQKPIFLVSGQALEEEIKTTINETYKEQKVSKTLKRIK